MSLLLIALIFLEIIQYIVFFDVVLSWLTLLGINFRPKFVADILDPIYSYIKKTLPTSIGPIDFTPIVIIMLVWFTKGVLLLLFPSQAAEAIILLNN